MLALLLVPFLLIISTMFMYRFSGKREFLQMDLVQFLFAFLVYPVGYIWLKDFLFILLREEIGVTVTVGQWITIDSAFTVFFMYFYAFGIIHALTKTFSLNLNRDPFYDIFEDSKYFHEFLSHVGMYVAILSVITILCNLNAFFPFVVEPRKGVMVMLTILGWLAGFILYIGAFYTTDKGVQYSRYRRIMKLSIGVSFLTQSIVYFVSHPRFSPEHGAFWLGFIMLTSTIVSILIFNPTKRLGRFLKRLPINGID